MKAFGILSAFILSCGMSFAGPLAGAATDPEATPFPLSGEYAFQGQLAEGLVTDYRVVHTLTPAGKAELQELIKQSYACEAQPSETFLCHKALVRSPLPEDLRERVNARFAGYSVAFEKTAGKPGAPDHESARGKEWGFTQKVRIGAAEYSFYRYQILQNTWHKIVLGEWGDEGAPRFVVHSAEQLSVVLNLSKPNPKGYRTYWVQALLSSITHDPKP